MKGQSCQIAIYLTTVFSATLSMATPAADYRCISALEQNQYGQGHRDSLAVTPIRKIQISGQDAYALYSSSPLRLFIVQNNQTMTCNPENVRGESIEEGRAYRYNMRLVGPGLGNDFRLNADLLTGENLFVNSDQTEQLQGNPQSVTCQPGNAGGDSSQGVNRRITSLINDFPKNTVVAAVEALNAGSMLRTSSAFDPGQCRGEGQTAMAREIHNTLAERPGYWVRGLNRERACKSILTSVQSLHGSCRTQLNAAFRGDQGLMDAIKRELQQLPNRREEDGARERH